MQSEGKLRKLDGKGRLGGYAVLFGVLKEGKIFDKGSFKKTIKDHYAGRRYHK